MVNIEKIKTQISSLIDETLKKTLSETNGIKHINYDPESDCVTLIVAVGKAGGDVEKNLRRKIAQIIKIDNKINGLKLQIEEHRSFEGITKKPITFIGIASGKGGVGKSTVAANLAYRFAKKGFHVGIMDADIYGSSIPSLLEIEHPELFLNEDHKIIPINKYNMEIISTEFFTEPGQAVIWRGGMLNSMLDNFFNNVAWNRKINVMFIDLPPGTGDIALDVKNFVPQAKMLIVTTPHPAASFVAKKAGLASKSMGHELLGIIENMSYFINPVNKEKEFIFGEGGGIKTAIELETELLTQIPIIQPIHHSSLFEIDEETGKIYDDLADELIMKLDIQK